MSKALNIFLRIAMFSIFIVQSANANMMVSPIRFQFDTKNNQKYITGSIDLYSNNEEDARFIVYPGYFEISKEGMIDVDFPSQHIKRDVKTILINPKELTLSPQQKQTIRFTIPNIDKLPDGESRAVVFIEDKKTKNESLPSPQKGINATLILKQRLAIPIYINHGKIVRSGTIETLNLNSQKQSELTIAAKGNSTIRVNGVVQLIQDKKVIKESKILDVPILANSSRIIVSDIKFDSSELKDNAKLKTKIYYLNAQNKKVILTKQIALKQSNN